MDCRHLLHVVPSGEWGSAERYAFDICRYFSLQGWEVKVLTREALAVDCHFRDAGIDIRHAPLRRYPDYYSARAMARIFAEMPIGKSIVHVHRYNDALTCILARKLSGRHDIRLVATRHKARPGRNSFLRRLIYKGIDSHLFVSEFSKSEFFSRWAEGKSPLSAANTDVIYNSVLHTPSSPSGEPDRGPVVAAYRGRLCPGRGLETLIDAFSMLKSVKVRLHIMGKGQPDYVDGLRQRAQRAGVADKIDWIRNPEFAEEKFCNIHFGVFPYEDPQAFSLSGLEFMAYGKAQISTFTGGDKEMHEAGCDALEVPPGDPEKLAEAIRLLAENPDLRLEMGRNAFQRFNSLFSWPVFIRNLSPYYNLSPQ